MGLLKSLLLPFIYSIVRFKTGKRNMFFNLEKNKVRSVNQVEQAYVLSHIIPSLKAIVKKIAWGYTG